MLPTRAAVAFVVTSLDSGGTLGHGLIYPEARYAGMLYRGATRIDRRLPFQTSRSPR